MAGSGGARDGQESRSRSGVTLPDDPSYFQHSTSTVNFLAAAATSTGSLDGGIDVGQVTAIVIVDVTDYR